MFTSYVLTIILKKELLYKFIKVNIVKGEQYNKNYKKLQLFSKVLVLNNNSFIIYKSQAICKYLNR